MARFRTLILVALLAGTAFAERKPFAFGLLGGVSGSTFWGKDVGEWDVTIFPSGGFAGYLNLPALLGVEMDLLYFNKGGTFKVDTTVSDGSNQAKVSSFTLHTLEVPLLLRITAPTGNEVMPYFFGGPAVAFLLSGKASTEIVTTDVNGTITPIELDPIIAKKNLETIDWTLTVGGGVEWGLGVFQLRLDLGQNSLDKSDAAEIKTLTISVLAGFIF